MAKLTAPLLSLAASGQIGKAMVIFGWKGIQVARQYVVPANPKTTLQQIQRNRLDAAVDEWQGAAYTATDQTAWNRFAGTLEKVMSGFNAMMRTHMAQAKLGNVWTRIYRGEFFDIEDDRFTVNIRKVSAGLAPNFRYGTSKTFMPNTKACADATGNVWWALITPLTPNTVYYGYFDVGASAATYGRTGIYQIKTVAA